MTPSFRDRLSMIDEHGNRLPLFPAEVRGVWRNRRTVLHSILLVIFLVLPWIRLNSAQAFLIDFRNGEFHFFGLKFWNHDAPLIFFLLFSCILMLALATALWGRIWCGWACPQTVFLDGVIRRIEYWTEGSHLKRRALAAAPWSLEKLLRKGLKWGLFLLFSVLLTHSLLATFLGTENLLNMMLAPPSENWSIFLLAFFLTGILLFDLAWFREQFCLIVCPYGRFQSVLMDADTVTVQYDESRGEPRKGLGSGEKKGDCVACNRCVQVCPTGIDIRNGIQMECVSCTACIDACDEIMQKVSKPKGLISYRSSSQNKFQWFRPRVLLYGFFLLICFGGLSFSIAQRPSIQMSLFRSTGSPYFEKTGPDGLVFLVNSYRLHVHNQTDQALPVKIDWLEINQFPSAHLDIPFENLIIKQNEFRMIPFLVEIPKVEMQGQPSKTLKFKISDQTFEVQFVGP